VEKTSQKCEEIVGFSWDRPVVLHEYRAFMKKDIQAGGIRLENDNKGSIQD
jgi:hypothetical protein